MNKVILLSSGCGLPFHSDVYHRQQDLDQLNVGSQGLQPHGAECTLRGTDCPGLHPRDTVHERWISYLVWNDLHCGEFVISLSFEHKLPKVKDEKRNMFWAFSLSTFSEVIYFLVNSNEFCKFLSL